MRKIRGNLLSVLLLIMGVILALTPWQLFKICCAASPTGLANTPMGYPMKCYYSGKLFVASGIILAMFAIFSILKNSKGFNILTSLIAIIIAISNYLLPMGIIKVGDMAVKHWQIGFCGMNTMSCVQNTQPAIMVILPIILILGIFLLVKAFLSKAR